MQNQPFADIRDFQEEQGGTGNDPRRRPLILAAMIVVAFVGIGIRVAYVQAVVAPRYLVAWQELTVEEEELPCRDGRILSRDGIVLAKDETRYDIAIDYRWLQSPPDPRWLRQQVSLQLAPADRRNRELRAREEEKIRTLRESMLASLSEVTFESPASLNSKMQAVQSRIEKMLRAVEKKRAEKLQQSRQSELDWSEGFNGVWKTVVQELTTSPDRFQGDPIVLKEELQDHVILNDVPLEAVATIQSQPGRFPGVRIRENTTRSYPRGDLAAHLIGLRKARPEQQSTRKISVRQGESGIERAQSKLLEGETGLVRHHQNRRHERIRSEQVRPPVDGNDVILTIDSRLQQLSEQLLDSALDFDSPEADRYDAVPLGAVLIAMDVWTGDVLTMACSPRPSLPVLARPTQSEWDLLQSDPRHPLFPRPTQAAFAPGGLFQVITSAAALQDGLTAPDETVSCAANSQQSDALRCLIIRQHGIGHGELNAVEAMARGCRTYSNEMGRRLGPAALCDWAAQFGLNEKTGIDLSGEVAGVLPDPEKQGKKWTEAATLQLANGQGKILVTPLQVTRLFAAIANGGYLLQPRVALNGETPDADGSSESRKITGLSDQTIAQIREGLERTIQSDEGTGNSARIEMMTLAGKNGVAEVSGKPGHAWFAGYAPAQSPRVAFCVVLENAGEENATGQIVRDFVTELLGYGYLRPEYEDSRQTSSISGTAAQ